MRIYRSVWNTTVALVALLALVAGGTHLGWLVLLGTCAALAFLGGLTGFTWVEGERRAAATLSTAGWFGTAALLLLGLPSVIGGWVLLVLAGIAASCPPAVQALVKLTRDRRPAPVGAPPDHLSERDLERRWRQTTEQVRNPGLAASATLRLVVERQWLLDELERRDPELFSARLVRAGWRAAPDRSSTE